MSMQPHLAPRRRILPLFVAVVVAAGSVSASVRAAEPEPPLTFSGKEGPGKGKQIVFVASAPEYDPQTGLPLLAKILAERHGFTCTVLFSLNEAGEIDPDRNHIPGLEALERADLLLIFTRFRTLPDDQMKHVVDYLERGGPVVGLRTATHAFAYPGDSTSVYRKYGWNAEEAGFDGGFGRQVLGETWITHHAPNGKTSTRGVFAPEASREPILRGVADGEIWGPTGVYGVRLPLPVGCKPLLLGQVVEGSQATGKAAEGKPNDPMMPVAWTRTYSVKEGKSGRALATTMGSAADLRSEAFRRFLVNGCYWAVGLEEKIPDKADVALVGEPVQFKKGMKPKDYGK